MTRSGTVDIQSHTFSDLKSDMRVSGGYSSFTQKSKFGVYKPTSEKINDKPVWKHVSSNNKIYFSKWNAWRIGPRPNWGGICAYDNTYGNFPSDIGSKWLFWGNRSWNFDSFITVETVNSRNSRNFDRDNKDETDTSVDNKPDAEDLIDIKLA